MYELLALGKIATLLPHGSDGIVDWDSMAGQVGASGSQTRTDLLSIGRVSHFEVPWLFQGVNHSEWVAREALKILWGPRGRFGAFDGSAALEGNAQRKPVIDQLAEIGKVFAFAERLALQLLLRRIQPVRTSPEETAPVRLEILPHVDHPVLGTVQWRVHHFGPGPEPEVIQPESLSGELGRVAIVLPRTNQAGGLYVSAQFLTSGDRIMVTEEVLVAEFPPARELRGIRIWPAIKEVTMGPASRSGCSGGIPRGSRP